MFTKKLDSNDSNLLFHLEKICFIDSYWSLEQIKSHFLINSGIGYFEQNNNNFLKSTITEVELKGYLLYLENNFELEILRFGVIPEKRRTGIAHLLLEELKKIEKEIFLEVNELNLPAIQLYKKNGFQIIGNRKNYYKEKEDALILKYIPFKKK